VASVAPHAAVGVPPRARGHDVRVERLQSITEDDAHDEGVSELDGSLDEVKLCERARAMGECPEDARVWFAEKWDAIYGKDPCAVVGRESVRVGRVVQAD
jgi:hypothetical protein